MIARPIDRRTVAIAAAMLTTALLACAGAPYPPASRAAAVLPDSATSFTADSNSPPRPHWVSAFAPEPSIKTPFWTRVDKNRNGISDEFERGRFRLFTRTPPWVTTTPACPFRGTKLVRRLLVFPNPASRGSILFVAVEERHKAIEWTAETFTSEGARLGVGLPNGSDGERISEQAIRIPATFADSIVVVRVVLPPQDTLYTTVRIR